MGHLRRLLKGAHSAEEEPFAFLVYKTNLMGILAAIFEHVVNLRMKSHEVGGTRVPVTRKLWSHHISTAFLRTSFI